MKYDEIVKKAKLVHGDKYSYPEFDKISVLKKMKIICPIHGEFEQVVYAHLRGQGCPKCIGKRRNYTTENFIKDATEKFGDKFDYSKTVYTNRREKVCIMCKELITEENPTGEFWQYPFVHLKSKNGMPFLGKRGVKYPKIENENEIEIKTAQFIEKARNVHGDKYDYSKAIYRGSKIKICIICPIHGEFWQMPTNHLKGCGCRKCVKKEKMNVNEFIEKAKKIHGNKYDYNLIEKLLANKKIKIICKKHGIFEQYYHHHLQGCGCPMCSNNKKSTTEKFIEEAKKIHGDKYDYSKVEYINNHTPVCIICPKHGEFWQMPAHHILSKSNCPLCNESKLEEEINLLLNENTIENIRQKKFNNIKNINPLPFDFYLPKYNVVIECQGIQHFEKSPFFKDINRIEKDVIKYNGCVDNGIKILYYTNVKGYKKYFNKIYNKNNLFVDKNKLLKEIKKV
jgi:very-short-patch-repair endonuclease